LGTWLGHYHYIRVRATHYASSSQSIYTLVRIGGALSANVEDCRYENETMSLDMIKKGAREHSLPISGTPRAFLKDYIKSAV